MKVYILNGSAQSGKDLFAQNVCTLLGNHGKTISTIDPIKKMCEYAGWDGKKTEETRRNLAKLKNFFTGWLDTSFKYSVNEVQKFENFIELYGGNPEDGVIFIMCREPNEITRLKLELNAKTIIIRRLSAEDHKWNNPADDDILYYNYDIQIENNDSLHDFAMKAYEFCQEENLQLSYEARNGFRITKMGIITLEME